MKKLKQSVYKPVLPKITLQRGWICRQPELESKVALKSFSSVAQLCLTLCDPMNCSTPGLPIHHQLLKLMSIESVMPSSHLILCRPLLLLSPTPTSIRVFSSESTLHMRWPKYWSFSFSIIPSKEQFLRVQSISIECGNRHFGVQVIVVVKWEKAFVKIQHPFLINTTRKPRI